MMTPSLFPIAVIILLSIGFLQLSESKVQSRNSRRLRGLQTTDEIWRLQEPVKTAVNSRVELRYQVSDFIEDDWFVVSLFRDKDCTSEINAETKEVLKANVFPDDTPKGTGYGLREFEVRVIIDENSIRSSGILAHNEDQAIMTFCIRIDLIDPYVVPRTSMNTLKSHIAAGLILADDGGVTGIMDDPALKGGIDIYQCVDSAAVETPQPTTQGQKLRLCISRNEEMKYYGLYFRGIEEFTFTREGVATEQEAVIAGSRVGDGGLTNVQCEVGSELCIVESVLQNDFFESSGKVQGLGRMLVQYGASGVGGARERHLRDLPNSRSLYIVGEIISTKTIETMIDVVPNPLTYDAEAFRCNLYNERVDSYGPLTADSPARVCIQPNEKAREAGVFMRRIDSFTFTRDSLSQKAIEDGEPAGDDNTLVLCTEGDMMCSLKTELDAEFFRKDGSVSGFGTVILQFGQENRQIIAEVNRGRSLVSSVVFSDARGLQDDGPDSDPGFAGASDVALNIDVSLSTKSGRDPSMWWASAPTHLRILYVLAFLVACLLVLCCCAGLLFLRHKRRDTPLPLVADERSKDSSMDAFMDSKASFYSDLDFMTDRSDDSSDESITEHDMDGNLVSILFPSDPDPSNLSRTLREDTGRKPRRRSSSMPLQSQQYMDSYDEPEQRRPFNVISTPQQKRDDATQISELTAPVNPLTGRPLRLSNASQGNNGLSHSEHGPTRQSPGYGGGKLGRRNLPDDRLSESEHVPRRNKLNDPLGSSAHSRRGRRGDPLASSEHSRRAGRHGSDHCRNPSPRRPSPDPGHAGRNPGRGRGPGRGLSVSEHGPRRGKRLPGSELGTSRIPGGGAPGRGAPIGTGRGRGRAPPAGRVPVGRNGIVPGNHPNGVTRVPIVPPTSLRGIDVNREQDTSKIDSNPTLPRRMLSTKQIKPVEEKPMADKTKNPKKKSLAERIQEAERNQESKSKNPTSTNNTSSHSKNGTTKKVNPAKHRPNTLTDPNVVPPKKKKLPLKHLPKKGEGVNTSLETPKSSSVHSTQSQPQATLHPKKHHPKKGLSQSLHVPANKTIKKHAPRNNVNAKVTAQKQQSNPSSTLASVENNPAQGAHTKKSGEEMNVTTKITKKKVKKKIPNKSVQDEMEKKKEESTTAMNPKETIDDNIPRTTITSAANSKETKEDEVTNPIATKMNTITTLQSDYNGNKEGEKDQQEGTIQEISKEKAISKTLSSTKSTATNAEPQKDDTKMETNPIHSTKDLTTSTTTASATTTTTKSNPPQQPIRRSFVSSGSSQASRSNTGGSVSTEEENDDTMVGIPVVEGDGGERGGNSSHDESSASSSSSEEDGLDIPDDFDVCFEAESHEGTKAFLAAVRRTIDRLGPIAYSPKVYRRIKQQLPGRRFYVCDDDTKQYDWREVTKSELIDLIWKYYEEEKERRQGPPKSQD